MMVNGVILLRSFKAMSLYKTTPTFENQAYQAGGMY